MYREGPSRRTNHEQEPRGPFILGCGFRIGTIDSPSTLAATVHAAVHEGLHHARPARRLKMPRQDAAIRQRG